VGQEVHRHSILLSLPCHWCLVHGVQLSIPDVEVNRVSEISAFLIRRRCNMTYSPHYNVECSFETVVDVLSIQHNYN
jgi:hypothetical protein